MTATNTKGTVGLEFHSSVGARGSYAIHNVRDAGNALFYFLEGLRKRGLFDGVIDRHRFGVAPKCMLASHRHDRFVAYAEANGFEVRSVAST